MAQQVTSTTSTAASANIVATYHYDFEREGDRLGLWERIVYAALVLLGKRRSYPICICAFSLDD